MPKTLIKSDALTSLMRADKLHIPEGTQVMVRCFSPDHEDKKASMSVNKATGQFYCHGCGIKGTAFHYLKIVHQMTDAEAMKKLSDMGWTEEKLGDIRHVEHVKKTRQSGIAFHTDLLYKHPRKFKDGRYKSLTNFEWVADYKYLDEKGECYFIKRRWEDFSNPDDIKKEFALFTKSYKGGWWVASPISEKVPEKDRRKKYTLYGIENLEDDFDRKVYFVEGEKCVDTIRRVMGKQLAIGAPCAVSCCGGANSNLDQHDLTPLVNRKVFLVADQDEAGRTFMRTLAAKLFSEYHCHVGMVLPPGDSGMDIADYLASGGWAAASEWINEVGWEIYTPSEKVESVEMTSESDMGGEYFRIMGLDRDNVVFQLRETAQLESIKKASLNQMGQLQSVAPKAYWRTFCYDRDGMPTKRISVPHREDIADLIIAEAKRKGIFASNMSMYGRGGACINGKYYYNLGSAVLLEDEKGLLTDIIDITEIEVPGAYFLPRATIRIHDNVQVAREAGMKLFDCICSCNWQRKEHAYAFAGFLVSSIMGGCLGYRPMLWLIAPATTGKSWIVNNIYKKLGADICHGAGSTTEAKFSTANGSDSLPAFIDEFEPTGGYINENRYQNLLTLIRLASTGDTPRERSGIDTVTPRFSAIVSSIGRADLSGADRSRFYFLRLHRGDPHKWALVEASIRKLTQPGTMLALRTLIIRHSAHIARATLEIEDKLLLEHPTMNSRERKVIAALTAGARFLSGRKDIKVVAGDRDDFSVEGEQLEPLRIILTKRIQIRLDSGIEWYTVGECLDKILNRSDPSFKSKVYEETLARYGMTTRTYESDSIDDFSLYIEPKNKELTALLKDTAYSNHSLKEHLHGLDGITFGERVRMAGRQVRCVRISRLVLEDLGLTTNSFIKRTEDTEVMNNDGDQGFSSDTY